MTLYKNIFLADDDAEDQEIFTEALQSIDSGASIMTARNGEAALQSLKDGLGTKPDIIFLDMNMPLMNGKQLLTKIKSLDMYKETPVIMYSTFFADKDLEEITRLGGAHCLLKPSKYDRLVKALDYILTNPW
jgi:CheY-like chemotaxis protein